MTETTIGERTELMRKIKDEVVNLKESPLYAERVKNRVFPVIGEGSHHAKIMFVGEAPGKNEAETGRTMVRPKLETAGRDRFIRAILGPTDRNNQTSNHRYSRQIFYELSNGKIWFGT